MADKTLSQLFDYAILSRPSGDPRHDQASDYDLNEPGRPWSEVRPEMEARLEQKLAAGEYGAIVEVGPA